MFIYRRTPEALNSQTQPRMGVSAHAGQAWVHLGGQMTIHWPASSGNTVPAPRRAAERGPFSHVRRASDAAWRGFFSQRPHLTFGPTGKLGEAPERPVTDKWPASQPTILGLATRYSRTLGRAQKAVFPSFALAWVPVPTGS